MHNVITNAWRGDPYKIDTLLLFMANMAWNSSMNTAKVREMLVDKDEQGEYKIPFIIVCDAFQSETVAFADLVLPDTTYLERHDAMSLLDRPISQFKGPVDSVRIPVLEPKGECKPFQEVIVEMGSRLKLPAFTNDDGSRKYRDYPDFIVNFETSPGSGIGFLSGLVGIGLSPMLHAGFAHLLAHLVVHEDVKEQVHVVPGLVDVGPVLPLVVFEQRIADRLRVADQCNRAGAGVVNVTALHQGAAVVHVCEDGIAAHLCVPIQ